MAGSAKHISFDEFAKNVAHIFSRVLDAGESIVVEDGEGKRVEIKPIAPAEPRGQAATREDDEAFLSAAGG